jgi:hypothetical protein
MNKFGGHNVQRRRAAQKKSCLLVSLRDASAVPRAFEAKHARRSRGCVPRAVSGADTTAVQRSAERPVETTCFLAFWQVSRITAAARSASRHQTRKKWPSPTPGSPTRPPSSRSF